MTRITLYGPARAPFVIKVRGALALKKLDYALVEPTDPGDYRRWSPQTGLLPVIDVDGVRVPDSSAILDHLEERFPAPPMLAADPKVASAQRRLERWSEATFMFYWRAYLRDLVDRSAAAGGQGAAGAEPRRRGLLRRGPSRPAASGLGAEFASRLDDLVNFLGARPFFYADAVSRADLSVYSFLRNIPDAAGPGVAAELDARPALRSYLVRVEQQIGTGFRWV